MLFIWRGDGAWVPVSLIGIGIVVEVLVAVISVNQAKAHTNLVIACILATSSGVVYLIARRVRGTPGPLVKNRGPGSASRYARKDEFFFVPLDYWPAVLLVAAIADVVIAAIRGIL
jgi:hypothetical protein